MSTITTTRSTLALGAALLLSLPACGKLGGGSSKDSATASPVTTGPVVPASMPTAAKPSFDVPFRGSFTRTAKIAFRNGQQVSVANAKGLGTLAIEPGLITFSQTYADGGKTEHVTQTYSFTQGDMKPVANGGYDVKLKFEKMDSDAKNYFPDDRDPHIQARKIGPTQWQIGLLLMDGNGTHGGSEFR